MTSVDLSFQAAEREASRRDRFFDALASFRLVFSVMVRADPARGIGLLVLRSANAVSPMVAALLLKVLVDSVASGSGSLVVPVVGLAVAFGVVLVSSWSAVVLEARLQEQSSCEFARRSAELVLGTPSLELVDEPGYRDRVELLRDDSASLPATVTAVIEMVAATAAAMVALIALIAVDLRLVLLGVCAIPSLVIGNHSERVRQQVLIDTAAPTREAAALFDLATDPASGKELRILDAADEVLARYERVSRDIVIARRKAWNGWALWRTLAWLVFTVGFGVSLVVLVNGVVDGSRSLGDVVLLLVLGAQVNVAVAVLTYSATFAMGAVHAVDRYRWLERRAKEHLDRQATPPASPDGREHRGSTGLELTGVSFRYADGPPVLDDIDLRLEPGTITLLVGENGAGKSTLMNLMAGFYEPVAGSIQVDGVPLRRLDPSMWRASMSVVFQDFLRFELLAREVVGVGELTKVDDELAVREALERAASPGLLSSFPRAAETPLGSSFEDGFDPSGGQWQKLALARSVMRPQPTVLLLDEPTSALDPLAESELLHAYGDVCRAACRATGGMVVIASHRLATASIADHVLVLDHGRIVEQGTHRELLEADGGYAELFRLQAKGFIAT